MSNATKEYVDNLIKITDPHKLVMKGKSETDNHQAVIIRYLMYLYHNVDQDINQLDDVQQFLTDRYANGDQQAQAAALEGVRELNIFNDTIKEATLSLLDRTDHWFWRMQGAMSAGHFKIKEAIPKLQGLISEDVPAVKEQCLLALTEMKAETCLDEEELKDRIFNSNNYFIIKPSVQQLLAVKGDEAIPTLFEYIEQTDSPLVKGSIKEAIEEYVGNDIKNLANLSDMA